MAKSNDGIGGGTCPPLTLEQQSVTFSGIGATRTLTFSKNVKAAYLYFNAGAAYTAYLMIDDDGNRVNISGNGQSFISISDKNVVLTSAWNAAYTFTVSALTADDIHNIPIEV